jgi:predicted dehydrogenase
LIESFYRAIAQGAPVPIPYREILLTARIMEAIFDQISVGHSAAGKDPVYAIS